MDTGQQSKSQALCHTCATPLCLRQLTINIALGNEEEHCCLVCLAKQSGSTPLDVLRKSKGYVLSRQCFRKEWVKYSGIADCPAPATCFPETCFDLEHNANLSV